MSRDFGNADIGRVDLQKLRSEFDQTFARAPDAADAATEGLLAIRVGGSRYVVRADEISGVGTAGKVIRVPSRARGLAGLTGIRGTLLPVFSLVTLLDEAPGDATPGWLFFVGREEPLAFAFHGIDAYRKVEPGKSTPLAEAARQHASLREVLAWDASVVPIIHVPSLVSLVRPDGGREGTRKEAR